MNTTPNNTGKISMNEENRIYEIPSWNISKLHKEIEKINKRAKKWGVDEIKLIEHGELFRVHPAYSEAVDIGTMNYDQAPKIRLIKFSVHGGTPKIAGWQFFGTLDHFSLPGKVIISTVPGQTIPTQFHNSTATCDHCNRIRRRTETFVVQHKDGNYKQVGRNCLRDFLGHDPSHLLSHLQSVRLLVDSLDDEDKWMSGGSHQEYYLELDRILTLTAAVIRNHGWVAKSAASPENGRIATATEVNYFIEPPVGNTKAYHQWKEEYAALNINDSDTKEANKALLWLDEQKDSNEYIHNLKMIREAGQLTYKLLGFACSIIAAYQRAMETLRIQKSEKKSNEYVGNIKDKIETVARLTKKVSIDGYYGTTYLHRLLDKDGHTLVWFSSAGSDMREGHIYRIKGTIKKQEEYNNWKQTVLTRVKTLEEAEENDG